MRERYTVFLDTENLWRSDSEVRVETLSHNCVLHDNDFLALALAVVEWYCFISSNNLDFKIYFLNYKKVIQNNKR